MFILLHVFRKHTAQIPKQDKELAQQRMRLDEQRKLAKGGR
ncbi:type II toxin-antitoxin system RelE/ParE family toxin [Candidatus Acetothermia bacterium]|nr:type II toxin-antitoxin system RelE/ParE family toxin [Candidatus Acetothermia bacterium]